MNLELLGIRALSFATFIVLGIGARVWAGPPPHFTLTDLGRGLAYDLNNSQQAAGYFLGDYYYNAAIFSRDGIVDLGTGLGESGVAGCINAEGVVVGSYGPTASPHGNTFIYGNGTLEYGESMMGVKGSVNALNDNGEFGGSVYNGGETHPALYFNGSLHLLDTPGGLGGSVGALNNNGDAAGILSNSGPHAFLYSNGVVRNIEGPGSTQSSVTDMNIHDDVVGSLSTGGYPHAFLYHAGVMQDLGTLGGITSTASSINDEGDVVGTYETPLGTDPIPSAVSLFLYHDGTMYNLNRLVDNATNWTPIAATGINNFGQIVTFGPAGDGKQHVFLLTPESSPEPCSLAIMSGFCGTLLARRRPS